MAYQALSGIKITPRGPYYLARFSKTILNGAWPTSYAFGGWIYNASCDIGYSNQPTEIKLSIVLEVSDMSQRYAFFDINDEDLKCDAGLGDDESYFDIDFNGVIFENFLLYEYSIDIQNNTKILTVTFKDYSIILDKIYIGLLKRQGIEFIHTSSARMEFAVTCPDCKLAGDSITTYSYADRDLAYGSYVGINGRTYDNFNNISVPGNIYKQWEAFFASGPQQPSFDLNGGFLMLGVEEATEERCGDLAPVSYNFNQLLASLRIRGMKFEGAFPKAITDADFVYRQNYIGTLREVLQQWCSDLAYDFYVSGKTFVGIGLNQPINIQPVSDVTDPTTSIGGSFALNQNSAILSYKSSSSLTNTFKQSVITTNNRPRNQKIHSKSPKRYVGILPLHPIDFNRHSNSPVLRYDALGTLFWDIAWANDLASPFSADLHRTLPELDGRMFTEIDTSLALGRYDSALRDIYCQDRALYGETPEIRAANFRALGMVPLVEITDDSKTAIVEAFAQGGSDEISNICRDQRFYRVFIGYYYESFKNDIVTWEQNAANTMYKYGVVVKGLLNQYPYMPMNQLVDMSPKDGLYGSQGTSLLRIQHSIEPSAEQYYVLRMAPFKDLILYSGLLSPSSSTTPIPIYNSGIFPTGLFYSSLNNEWGTSVESFKRYFNIDLIDPCVAAYGADTSSYDQMINGIPKKFQDWRLDYFRPIATPDLERFWDIADRYLQNIPNETQYDRTSDIYYDLNYIEGGVCSKLHFLVLPDVRTHPNIAVSIDPKGREFINSVMLQSYIDRTRETTRRRIEMKTPTECDLTLLYEMCRNYISGQSTQATGDPRFGCIMEEDKWNWLEEGFTYSYLTQPNSRGIEISITKNPIRNNGYDSFRQTFAGCDINGDMYYTDLFSQLLETETYTFSHNIVYPVETNAVGGPDGMYYRGCLSSEVDVENRTPEIIEVFGTPINSTSNNSSSIKVINNPVDLDLQPQLDPYSSRFWSYMTLLTGSGPIVATVEQYHHLIRQLNSYEMTTPMKTVELSIAGSPNDFGLFKNMLTPTSGLNKLSMSVNDNGLTTNLSFSDRPKVLPKQESILNKIGPRIK